MTREQRDARHEQQRQEQDEDDGRQTGEVQQVRDPPSHRGRCVGGQRQAPGSDVNHHEVAQTFVYLSRREALDFRRQSIHMPLQRVAERGFLTNLAHRSSLPVDVHRRRRHLVRAHPLEKVRLGGEALTTREDRAQPGARAGAHIDEKVVGITVHVAEKRQASRIDRRLDSVHAVVGQRAIVHDEKTRDVQAIELPERDERVVGPGVSRRTVHRLQQPAQLRLAARVDRCQDHE